MARGRTRLDANQQAKLRAVAEADDAWRHAKKHALQEAKKIAAEKVAQYLYVRDVAIRDAIDAGVPKVLVGEDGIGNSNPYAIRDALERVGVKEVVEVDPGRFFWGEILAADENWVYGWVVDNDDPELVTASPVEPDLANGGYWVVVDKHAGVVPSLTRETKTYTMADGEFAELREWAVLHADEVEAK